MGEPETPHFYAFGIFGRVPGSQDQLFFFGDITTPKKREQTLEHFLKCVCKSKVSEIQQFGFVRTYGCGKPVAPSNKLLEILDTGSISSETTK